MQPEIKLIFLSDTHLGLDYPVRPRIQRRRRGVEFFDNFKRVLDYAIRSKADLIVHGGDFFFRSLVPDKIVELAYGILKDFSQCNIPLYIVPGNHERSRLPRAEPINWPNIYIFDRPRSFVFERNPDLLLSGFPYERNNIKGRFKAVLDSTCWRSLPAEFRVLCLHHAIAGASVGPSNYTFLHGNDVIQVEDLPAEFQMVLSGHIHRGQHLVKKSETGDSSQIVAFAGSTERTSFAEKDETKGFFEFNIGRNDLGRLILCDFRFIELPTRPMVDLFLNEYVNLKNLKHHLHDAVSEIDRDAIVRLRADVEIKKEIREMLSAAFLRGVFPETMNFQLSRNLFT